MSYLMTSIEIRARFRTLHPKQDRIRILAELNGCDTDTIMRMLQMTAPKPKLKKVYRPRINQELFRALYEQGMTDDEIAKKLDRDKTSICQWRKKNNLKPHRKVARR